MNNTDNASRTIETYICATVAHRGNQIEVWTEDDLRLTFDRRYTTIVQPGTVFDVEWDGPKITGLRVNSAWAFHVRI